MSGAAGALEEAFRHERAAVLATITRRLGGDLALAEDAVQEAFLAAATDWERTGVPDRPGAWLTTAAWRRALDRLRHDRVAAARARDLAPPAEAYEEDFERSSLEDDQLRMLFACCHPALAPDARMALTLRSVAGLTVPEIARGMLTTEAAMEQRLVRARRKVADARIPFRVPSDDQLGERLPVVLRVLYLLYTDRHLEARGCEEAIRLARLVARLMPDADEAQGLLALLLLTDARRPARLDERGDLVALADQDRARWDADAIAEGVTMLDAALRLGRPGPYVVQAAIAALHAQAASFAETDWAQIAGLYAELERREPSPVVTVNRAVATGFAEGPTAGLAVLDSVADDPRLARYLPLHAARADLLRRAGDAASADAAYATAIGLASGAAERAALERERRAARAHQATGRPSR